MFEHDTIKVERSLKALQLRADGHTYVEIGEMVGSRADPSRPICQERAGHLISFAFQWLGHPSRRSTHPLAGLRDFTKWKRAPKRFLYYNKPPPIGDESDEVAKERAKNG